MKSYQIHFIRHGATAANREGRYVGVTDTPLSQEGICLLYTSSAKKTAKQQPIDILMILSQSTFFMPSSPILVLILLLRS